MLFAAALPAGCGCSSGEVDGPKAAIIDQLYLRQPNPEFIAEAKELLGSIGLTVDVWQGDNITVDFYRDLPSMGYHFILLRVHAGTLLELVDGEPVELPYTYLFTAEEYTTSRYITDQLSDKVAYAIMDEESPEVFAVNSQFIKSAKGAFENTVILSMGCESYRHNDLMQAFMDKGASLYIGWSDIVTLDHVDTVTLELLDEYCSANLTIGEGIKAVTAQYGYDPYFGSYLKYFPVEAGGKTLGELVRVNE